MFLQSAVRITQTLFNASCMYTFYPTAQLAALPQGLQVILMKCFYTLPSRRKLFMFLGHQMIKKESHGVGEQWLAYVHVW